MTLNEITEIHQDITPQLAGQIRGAIKTFFDASGYKVYLSGNVQTGQILTPDSELTIVVKRGADKITLHINLHKERDSQPFLLLDGCVGGVKFTNQNTDDWQEAIKQVMRYIE